MATYVNDLRLKEITTGDESGTWGTSTNTNLELIAEAFSYGTEVITTNADTHTTTIADGATDPGRSLYLKYTGTLDSACTITIGPNTVSKVWIIENGTSGSQDIILSQGSGANITIPAGDTKVVYSDGAGAGAAFFDAFANLKVTDPAQTNITSVGTLSALTGGTGDLNWDSGTLFVDSSANNVGIGTTSVGTKLNIRSDASDDGILLEKSDGTDIARLFHDGTSTNARFDMFSGGSATVQIKASGNTHFSGGNVGIGESSPQELLHLTATTPVFRMQGGSRTYQQFVSGTDFVIRDVTATANRITLDSSGNLLVGKSATGLANAGIEFTASNILRATKASTATAEFNRTGTDGDIAIFWKDTSPVGSIGTEGGDMAIGNDDAGIQFVNGGEHFRPFNMTTNVATDGLMNIGSSSKRFNNLYLSGGVIAGNISGASGSTSIGGSDANYIVMQTNVASANPRLEPSIDNTIDFGRVALRYTDIYATNATINTSDRNEKQDIAELSDAEQSVAVACKGLLRKFRWKDRVADKGDDARIHFGIIAQDLQAAFEVQGLDAGDYAMFISSTWWETQTEVAAVEAVEEVTDEEGNVTTEAVEAKDAYTRTDTFETLEEAPEGATERTRLGVRYSELLAFIIAAI
jgi:hypothetical protein